MMHFLAEDPTDPMGPSEAPAFPPVDATRLGEVYLLRPAPSAMRGSPPGPAPLPLPRVSSSTDSALFPGKIPSAPTPLPARASSPPSLPQALSDRELWILSQAELQPRLESLHHGLNLVCDAVCYTAAFR